MRCLCECHYGSVGDRRRADGVDCANPIEAAVACEGCRHRHVEALLSMRLANAPAPRIITPWEDPYEKKTPPAPDTPPTQQDDGN